MKVTQELWYPEPAEDPAHQEAARSLAAMVGEMRGLRPFSPAVQKLLVTIQNEYYTVEEVTRIIESDTSLAARVMRTVNSAAVGLRSRCKSLSKAITLLGARAIASMATAMSLIDKFSGDRGAAAVVTAHSAGVASCVRLLGAELKLPERDALFTCGLLHDLGKLLMLQVSDSLTIGAEHDPYPKMIEVNKGRHDVVHVLERTLYGYDHAVLAAHVLQVWQLPAPVPQVVAWHHQPDRAYHAGGDMAKLVAAVRLADRMAYELRGLPEPDHFLIGELAADPAAKLVALDEARLEKLWPDIHAAVNVTHIGD
jgi:HD-like signal output (HDOD) protein